jgi:hypothetical protein
MKGEAAAGEEKRCSLCLTPWYFLLSNTGSLAEPGWISDCIFIFLPIFSTQFCKVKKQICQKQMGLL